MKVRQLKRRVRKVVYYEWRDPPRRVEVTPAMVDQGLRRGHGFRKAGAYMVGGHGFGWKPVWVRPR
jgi:hypothetical protein